MREPDDTTTWDEFEWERALRESDEYAARYFQLLLRFCDLPSGNELIAKQLERDFGDKVPDCDFDCPSCEGQWDCEFSSTQTWPPDEGAANGAGSTGISPEDTAIPGAGAQGAEEEDDEEEDDDTPAEQGDPFFYESDPTFNLLRQTAIGWCNIYAAILTPDSRATGMRILFHIGRSLANLAYSIGDGSYEEPAGSVAFAKRSLAQLNEALGQLAQLTQDKPRLDRLLGTIRSHMLQARSAIIDHLQRCRERTGAPPPLPAPPTD